MPRRALVAAIVFVWSAPVGAEGDLYRWVDESGRVHYSNAPSRIESRTAPERIEDRAAPPAAATSETDGNVGTEEIAPTRTAPSAGAGGAPKRARGGLSSAQTSLARHQLERQQRDTRKRLGEVDRELERLAADRLRFAERGPAAVGGLAASGAPLVRSPAEEALEQERELLTKRLEEIRERQADLSTSGQAGEGGRAAPAGREGQ